MIAPGLYGLASLDGAPLDPEDLRALSLLDEPCEPPCETLAGLAARAVDFPFAKHTISVFRAPGLLVLFNGHLDEPEDLANTLGLASTATPVALAMAAVERFGKNAPTQMLGGWSLLRWESDARKLTLIHSERTRDPMYFSTSKGKLAFAPDMGTLLRLTWVGRELDPIGFPLSISVARLRHIRGDATLWKGVLRSRPQSTEVFKLAGCTTTFADPLPEPEPWRGSYQDALDASNALGRRIVRQEFARYGKVGLMLSGGLDSTLVATWAAQEVGAGQQLFCVTSVAPPGLGLEAIPHQDEREYAVAVAEHLGLEISLHYPEHDRSAYVPDAALYRATASPVFDLRHYVGSTMFEAIAARGACAVMTGSGGEFTVTDGHFPPRTLSLPLRLARDARNLLRSTRERGTWPQDAFLAHFAAPVYDRLPPEWEKVWRAGAPQLRKKPATLPRGMYPAVYKTAGTGTANMLNMRSSAPMMDPRFFRLGARMPAEFTYRGGLSRAMAREMLKGHVPDFVRLRYRKSPFGPDYEVRLARQAPQARERLSLYTQNGVGEWLDLKWLGQCVTRLEAGVAAVEPDERFTAHLGILSAEFLLWNKSRTQ